MKQPMTPTRERWRQMIEDIVESDADGVTCAELDSELMAGYVDARLAHEEPGPQYADLHRHVTGCTRCTADVDAMLHVLRAEQRGALATPGHLPVPDLAFLAGGQPSPSIGDSLRDLFAVAEGWVRDHGSIWIDYGALLGQSNQLASVRAVRNTEDLEDKPIQRISLGADELEDCDLEIAVWETDDPNFCKVVLQVNISNRWPLLSDVEVAAMLGEQKWAGRTDGKGRVEFDEIPVDKIEQILFRITLP